MRNLTRDDIEALAIGAAILGTGGGGNPYLGKLRCFEELKKGGEIRLIGLDELADDARVVSVGGIGAPVVGIEKLREGEEFLRAVRAIEEHTGEKADAVIAFEIGGGNSMNPMVTAAQAGIPVVDADGMGRAFPEMQMTTYSIYGQPTAPAALADDKGNVVLIQKGASEKWVERLGRTAAVAMGGSAGSAMAPMSGSFAKRYAIPGTVTQAITLGYAVMEANRLHHNPIETICQRERGVRLFEGKIVDLQRRLEGGFARGEIRIDGLDAHAGSTAMIAIQNEFLVFRRDGKVEVSVPDLILVLDLDTGHAITTEVLRYGQRVAVVGLPCHPLLQTEAALKVIGPAAFGLDDVVFRPLARAS
ncbi:DUF917 domain-containing protein [Reyranella sp.]|uniref:DUF917 domain-containing protein n=1 Tax=Reyranella sp. TaxID=1929291 RepID=UPI003D0B8D14